MAKRKRSKKSAKTARTPLADGLVSEIFAIVLAVVAVLLLVAFFGGGGSWPNSLVEALRWLFGLATYCLPALLAFISIRIFLSEEGRLSGATYFGLLLVLLALSGLFHIGKDELDALDIANNGDGGGMVGYGLDKLLLGFLNGFTATIVLIGMMIIGLLLSLNVRLRDIWQWWKALTAREEPEESPFEEVKASELKLNAKVPLNNGNGSPEPEARDEVEALTASADPTWNYPSLDLLEKSQDQADAGDWKKNANIIKETLSEFGIAVEMDEINVGPRVTQYTFTPHAGVRLAKITALEHNLALNLAAHSIRIEAPIPGKRAVGIEVPNMKSANVRLRTILESDEWKHLKSQLGFGIGQDIAGHPFTGALDAMPHLLIAGATGSGKSVMINTLLVSLLYRNSPADLKLILVDPKQVELSLYNDIPHLLTPVITNPEKCISALKWATAEMDRRYDMLAEHGKRNIADYNKSKNEESMPFIVIVIDELADLMMLAARDVESLIVRLAQKARATGIHLVLATQRPSVDVITGLIKANVPARIAFTVASQVDSRTILDQAGAEKLLGRGDMLLGTPELSKPKRIQGVLIEENEVKGVADHLRNERAPEYNQEIVNQPVHLGGRGSIVSDVDMLDDSLYRDAVGVVIDSGKASASLLQRRLRVGYARAARLIETMEEQGIVGPADGARPREVLATHPSEVFGDETESQG